MRQRGRERQEARLSGGGGSRTAVLAVSTRRHLCSVSAPSDVQSCRRAEFETPLRMKKPFPASVSASRPPPRLREKTQTRPCDGKRKRSNSPLFSLVLPEQAARCGAHAQRQPRAHNTLLPQACMHMQDSLLSATCAAQLPLHLQAHICEVMRQDHLQQ